MADTRIVDQTLEILLIPRSEFDRVRAAELQIEDKLALLADMNRANTLSAVKRAGSGHLGSSLSAMEIVSYLYYHEMNVKDVGIDDVNRDIYFSSKGHDVPGLYATLYSLGIISKEKLLKLRRFGGLDGHPDVGISGIEANSGSLGMGISKGKGIAWAKKYQRQGGRVFVLTGDGEFQEGQNYEALQSAAHHGIGNLIVIMDHNKVQSDKTVEQIVGLGELKGKLEAFGWYVARCDGHDLAALRTVFEEFGKVPDIPKFLIADTLKGAGVSFMEHPLALKHNDGIYPWHAGAPDDEAFVAAYREIILRVADRLTKVGLDPIEMETIPPLEKQASGVTQEYVADAFGQALVELGQTHPNLIVIDADLAVDCRIRDFEKQFPERFIENGIAEQDMVSTACGIASAGLLPVVNSFASFLASRANEQIYNAESEHRKIIYALHYAGLIPAGPGKSHQSIRDISLLAVLPDIEIIQPGSFAEARMAAQYAVKDAPASVALRLVIGPSPRHIDLPDNYELVPGRGVTLRSGDDALMFAYGPVMLNEALTASELLAEEDFSLQIVNMPWLNRVDDAWLSGIIAPHTAIYVLEDHAPVGGLGDFLLGAIVRLGLSQNHRFEIFGVEGWPACGTPPEALKYHGLDGVSLARRVKARSLA